MVLFREDERRIREIERQEKLAKRTRLGRFLRRVFKIALVLGIFMGISLLLLAALGGTHPALKKGMEDYLTQATGMQAEINQFNYMGFVPLLQFDAGNIVLRRGEDETPAVVVGHLTFSVSFFDLMLSRHRIGALAVKDIHAVPGVFGEHELVIDYAGIEENAVEGKPALVVRGRYGKEAIAAHMTMEGQQGSFVLPDTSAYRLSLGDILLRGTIGHQPGGGVRIMIDTLAAPDDILMGSIVTTSGFAGRRINADIEFGRSRIQMDLKTAKTGITGKITFPVLDLADLAVLDRLRAIKESLPLKKDSGLIDLYAQSLDIKVAVAALKSGEAPIGQINFPVTLHDQELAMGPFAGTIQGGNLAGRIYMDARSMPAALSVKGALKDWDMGRIGTSGGAAGVSATADILVDLESKSRTYDGLIPALSGEAAMVAGEGKFASAALNIWGAGLINAMLPSADPESLTAMNCMIADFKVENGIAKAEPLFIDTARLTVAGAGQVNLVENNIDLKLEPKAKDPALLDVATAINVRGPIQKPAITTDSFSLFEKIGGLALGFVNPAFLAFSMTDLGLTEKHPCHKYIGKLQPVPADGTSAP